MGVESVRANFEFRPGENHDSSASNRLVTPQTRPSIRMSPEAISKRYSIAFRIILELKRAYLAVFQMDLLSVLVADLMISYMLDAMSS